MLVQGYPSLSFSSFSSFKCQAKHLTTVSFRRTLLKKMRTQRHFPSWVAQLPRGWDKSRDGIISYWYNSMGVYGFIDYVIVNIQSLNTRTFWWSRIFEWRLPTFQEYALSATSILANRNRLVSIWPRRLSGRALYAVKCRICIYWSVCTHTHTHTHALYTLHPHFDRFRPRLEKDLDAATNNARADSASWLPMGASSLKKWRGN